MESLEAAGVGGAADAVDGVAGARSSRWFRKSVYRDYRTGERCLMIV